MLRQQHKAGRTVTEQILKLSSTGLRNHTPERDQMAHALRMFIRMYRPHEAREDTVLFPALHQLISRHEWDSLGDEFEKKEHELFGKEGFEGMVEKVAGLKKKGTSTSFRSLRPADNWAAISSRHIVRRNCVPRRRPLCL